MMFSDTHLHIPADEKFIDPVCEFTYSWCLNCGLSSEKALHFTVAVSELITDIVLFAYPHTNQAWFDIEFQQSLSNIEFIVSEVGEPFDPDRHRYDYESALQENNFEGAGLHLVQHFCDDFAFINKGKEGKEFRLSINKDLQQIDEMLGRTILQKEESRESDSHREPSRLQQFSFNHITPADAEDIAKLIYRSYEYTYSKEDMYFPKKIEEALQEKEKLGVITRNAEQEAIGYFSVLKKKDSNIAEVGEAVVSPDYRRMGVMSTMMEHLISFSREQNMAALYGTAVTLHPASQKVNHKYGFKSSALMLADTNKVIYKGFDEEYPQPVSVVIDFLPLDPAPQNRTVYPPLRYKEIIQRTYENLDWTANPQIPGDYTLAPKSDIKLTINYADLKALITVNKYGSDFQSVLKEMIESLEEKDLNVIYLDLPLQNSATPAQYEKIRSLAFLYCGLAPLFHYNTDYLRLQKIRTPLDLDLIELYSDFGKEIKSLIAEEYGRYSKR